MKKFKLLFAVSFLLLSHFGFSQFVKYSDGYIILNSGEKIEGKIKTTNAVNKAHQIIFIYPDGLKLKYKASDLQEYKIGNDVHVSANIPEHFQKVFLKEVITKYDVIFVYYYYHKPAKNATTSPCDIIVYGDDYVIEANGKKLASKTFKKESDKWILLNHCKDTGNTRIIQH